MSHVFPCSPQGRKISQLIPMCYISKTILGRIYIAVVSYMLWCMVSIFLFPISCSHTHKGSSSNLGENWPLGRLRCLGKRGCERAEDLEIVLQHNSRVEKSPRKIIIADIKKLTNPTIRLLELKLRKPYDRVSVMGKVLKVKQPVHVSGGSTKQHIIIADEKV